jgi:hypothetical protein
MTGTDAEVLATLRDDSDCPGDVLALAERAVVTGKGLLAEAHNRAEAATSADTVGSSNSSSTILAARVPNPDSNLANLSRTYYARLRNEIGTALGLPPSVSLYGENED